jgi:hypothetical protein
MKTTRFDRVGRISQRMRSFVLFIKLISKGRRGRCDNTEEERRIIVGLEKSAFIGWR